MVFENKHVIMNIVLELFNIKSNVLTINTLQHRAFTRCRFGHLSSDFCLLPAFGLL